MSLFKPYHIATTNAHKLREIVLAGFQIASKSPAVDAPEPMASLPEIVIDKSRRAGPMSIVEDTALFIDGCPDAGVTIKQFEKDRRMHEAIGSTAVYRVAMAINDGTTIFVVERALFGTIVPPEDAPSQQLHSYNGYVFTQFFKPVGFKTTYDAALTEFALEASPRVGCVKALENLLIARVNYERFDRLTQRHGGLSASDGEIMRLKDVITAYAPSNGPLWSGAFQVPC